MRYLGQEHTVNVPVANGELGEEQRSRIEGQFHELHEQLYTFRQQSPTEIVNLHLVGLAPCANLNFRKYP
jgi:N-methylhydantoinase A